MVYQLFKQKFIKFLLLIIIAGLFLPGMAQATPPLDVQLNYSLKDESLDVKIRHPSQNLGHHFIRKVVLYKNEAEIETKYFKRQPDPYEFTVNFSLTAMAGDTVRVVVYCEKGGSKEGTLLIAQEPAKIQEGERQDVSPPGNVEEKK